MLTGAGRTLKISPRIYALATLAVHAMWIADLKSNLCKIA